MKKYSDFLHEKYSKLIKYLKKEPVQSNNEFISEHTVWNYLQQIAFDTNTENFLKKSFRTRAKIDGAILDFQFKIDPSSISEEDIMNVEMREKFLREKLSILLPKNQIETHIKLSPCCGKNCFGCTRYQNNITNPAL
jgi:hypothetical protein